MAITELQDFYLVGGTNMALRYGRRTSVDLDFFLCNELRERNHIQNFRKEF